MSDSTEIMEHIERKLDFVYQQTLLNTAINRLGVDPVENIYLSSFSSLNDNQFTLTNLPSTWFYSFDPSITVTMKELWNYNPSLINMVVTSDKGEFRIHCTPRAIVSEKYIVAKLNIVYSTWFGLVSVLSKYVTMNYHTYITIFGDAYVLSCIERHKYKIQQQCRNSYIEHDEIVYIPWNI